MWPMTPCSFQPNFAHRYPFINIVCPIKSTLHVRYSNVRWSGGVERAE